VIIAVNGNAFFGLGDLAKEGNLQHIIRAAWNSAMGISTKPPYYVNFSNCHFIDLAMDEAIFSPQLQDMYHHFSYMAKVDTKPFGDGRRNYGCSNLNNAGWFLMTQQIKRKGA
tara:strand:+ start:58 stop:396 length:339 start_codon:yes stop_codon:yes gene_type:complete